MAFGWITMQTPPRVPSAFSLPRSLSPMPTALRRFPLWLRLAVLGCLPPSALLAGNGTWTRTSSGGLWSTPANWSAATVADGTDSTADFSTLNPAADLAVQMDAPRTIGSLRFGDTTPSSAAGWLLDDNGNPANTLTLAGSAPSIFVDALGTGKAANLSLVLAGSSGFAKTGNGTLVLSAANTLSGNVTVSAGSLQIADPAALGSTSGLALADAASLRLRADADTTFAGPPLTPPATANATVTFDVAPPTSGAAPALTLSGGVNFAYPGSTTHVFNVTGSGDARLVIPAVTISNTGTSGGSQTRLRFNPTTANLTLGNFTTTTTASAHDVYIILDGTTTGSRVTGRIANTTSGAAWTFLTKQGTGAWTISGATNSNFAGIAAITAGILNVQVNNALGNTNRGTTVSDGATLQLQSATSLNYATAEALTLRGQGVAGAGALQSVSGNNTFAGLITLAAASRINCDSGSLHLSNAGTLASTPTTTPFALTIGGAGDTRISGIIGPTIASLVKDGAGTLTLAGVNTFNSLTDVRSGTLALSANGTLPADSSVQLAPAASLDVSALPAASLAGNASLAATGSASAPALLRGGTSVALGGRPLTLSFIPASPVGDLTRPALHVASGTFTLDGPVTVINSGASPLGPGTYTVATQASGSFAGIPVLSGVVGGLGLTTQATATLQLNGPRLDLVVTSPFSTSTTLARRAGTAVSSNYGTVLEFNVSVSPATADGLVELRSGGPAGTLVRSATVTSGTALIRLDPSDLAAGTYDNLVALYRGESGHDPSVSTPLAPAQTVTPRTLTLSGAAAQNKPFDGTTAATFTAVVSNFISGDDITLIGTGTFAQSAPGTTIPVTATATLAGADAANYTFTQPTGLTASILATTRWTGAANDQRWSTGTNWSSGLNPNGSTAIADFTGLDLDADALVRLDLSRSVNQLLFSDPDSATPGGWTLDNFGNSANILNLAGTTPAIQVGPLATGRAATVSAILAGSAGLTKTGPGALILAAANTYTGGTFVNEGVLRVTTTGALSSGAATIGLASPSAALELAGGDHAFGANTLNVGRGAGRSNLGVVRQSSGNVSFTSGGNAVLIGLGSNGLAGTGAYELSGGTLTSFASTSRGVILGTHSGSAASFTLLDSGVLALGSAALQVGRSDFASLNASATYEQTGGNATVGTLSIGGGATSTGTAATFRVTGGNFTATSFTTLAAASTSRADLTLGGSALVTLPAFPTRAGNVTLTLDFTSGSLTPPANSSTYIANLTDAFLTANGATLNVPSGRDITIPQSLENAPGQVGVLRKIGTGNLRLTGNNTYTGNTTVEAGILVLNSPGSLAGPLTVKSGAQLIGNGTVSGPVVIEDGGTLNPSNSASVTLHLGSSLTLSANSTTTLRADRSAVPNTCKISAAGTVVFGGTLKVTQAGADFQAGDQLDLIDASTISGAFDSVLLPALGYGLKWDSTQLASNGTVTVLAFTPTVSTTTLLPATTQQQIHGIGANYCLGPNGTLAWNTNLFNQAFSSYGLNMSFVRLANSFECWIDEPNIFWSGWDSDNARFIRMFRASQPDGLITMSAWSPPGSLKSTGSAQGGTLAKSGSAYRYADYADWWLRSLQNLRDNNPTLSAEEAIPDFISIQNECDFTPSGTFYAAWQAGNYLNSTETSTKAGYPQALAAVKSSFQANGFGFVKFVGPDTTTASPSVISAYLNNLPANSFAAIAHHPYQGSTNDVGHNTTSLSGLRAAYPNSTIYMTEFFGDDSYGAGVPDWMIHALPMHNVLTIEKANAYIMWGLSLTTTSGSYCAMGHYSKFIRPNDWRSAATTTDANVLVSLYRHPVAAGIPDQLTLVMTNKSAIYSYQTVQTSAHWATDPARRAWKVYKTADDGSTQQRLTLVEDLSGATLTGNRNLVLAPYSITTVVINTDAAPTALESWRIQYFGTTSTTGTSADLADPDADGEANLLEFATGQNPLASTRANLAIETIPGASPLLSLVYTRSKTALSGGVGFAVETSDTLATGNWVSGGVTTTVLTDNGVTQSVRATVPLTGAARRFLRLKVTAP